MVSLLMPSEKAEGNFLPDTRWKPLDCEPTAVLGSDDDSLIVPCLKKAGRAPPPATGRIPARSAIPGPLETDGAAW